MAETIEQIFEELISAAEDRNAAKEILNEAIIAMNVADKKLERALETFAEHLGEQDQSGEGSILGLNTGSLNLNQFKSITDIFGDLF